MFDKDRLNHSLAVANKMVEIGENLNLKESDLQDLFILGYNHDIGYDFCSDKKEHNIVGGEILKNNGYKYWKEVYYHGRLTREYSSQYLDILNCADMQIDKYGNDVGFEKRLEDIKSRYGEESEVYLKCAQLVEYLKNKVLAEKDFER